MKCHICAIFALIILTNACAVAGPGQGKKEWPTPPPAEECGEQEPFI